MTGVITWGTTTDHIDGVSMREGGKAEQLSKSVRLRTVALKCLGEEVGRASTAAETVKGVRRQRETPDAKELPASVDTRY
jgi:hypothetical protein